MANQGLVADCRGASTGDAIVEASRAVSTTDKDAIELKDMAAVQPIPIVEAKKRSKLRLVAVLLALSLSLFIAALDQTIVSTAVPTITSEFRSASGYVWVGGAYLLANAAAGPIWAKLSDIWGRKPILLAAVAFFSGSSIICALASDMKMLIIGRSLQGTAGGGLIQLNLITISDLFSVRSRALAFALIDLIWVVAGSIGPLLGGTFTQELSWRWCFWINLPITGTAFVLLLIFLDVHNPRTSMIDGVKAIDWFGSLSILGLTLMLLLGLQFGGATFPWKSPQVICLVIFGALMSGFFIFSEKHLARYPLMPLALFNDRSNVASLLLCFGHGIAFVGADYYLPLYFQSVMEASPLRSGVLILPLSVMEAALGVVAGVIVHRTGRYLEVIYVGTTLMTIGSGLYTLLSADISIAKIVGFQLIAGSGVALLWETPLIAIQAFVAQKDTSTATATYEFVRNLATSLSVVIGGVIFQNSMDIRVSSLSHPPISLSPSITSKLSGGNAAANVMVVSTIKDAGQKLAVKQAFAWSLRNLWIFYLCIAALTVVASGLIKRRHLSREHVETRTGLQEEVKVMAVNLDLEQRT